MAGFMDGKKKFKVENVGRCGRDTFYLVASTPEDGHSHNYGIPLQKGVDNHTPAWKAMCQWFGEERAKYSASKKKSFR